MLTECSRHRAGQHSYPHLTRLLIYARQESEPRAQRAGGGGGGLPLHPPLRPPVPPATPALAAEAKETEDALEESFGKVLESFIIAPKLLPLTAARTLLECAVRL